MNDPINPTHYKTHPSGVECIAITEHMGFCLGNAVKYIWRADEKGQAIEDLKITLSKGNKNIMLCACTGAGKSIIIKTIFQMALDKNPNASLLYVVHRKILINQMKSII